MSRKDTLSSVATILLVLCIVVLTGVVVRREFFPPNVASRGRTSEKLSSKEWQLVTNAGHRFGPENARVTVVEFSDFECPFCARFARDVARVVMQRYPEEVAIVFRHLPLTQIHKFAYPAARAAECAGRQHAFEAFHDRLFEMADSIGSRSFEAFARDAGVKDVAEFVKCSGDTTDVAAIRHDTADAGQLRVRATPTVFANGWRLNGGVDLARLDSLVKAELKKPSKP